MKPILSIWIYSKKTFQFLKSRNTEDNTSLINTLFFFSSMPVGFSNSFDMHRIIGGNYYVSLIVALIISGLLGVAFWNYIFSYIIWGMGKLFKGKSSIENTRLVLACSVIPNLILLIIGFILIIPAIILHNESLIGYNQPIASYILLVFKLKIMVVGLKYFNNYSYLFATLTAIIPIAMLAGLIYGLKYLII